MGLEYRDLTQNITFRTFFESGTCIHLVTYMFERIPTLEKKTFSYLEKIFKTVTPILYASLNYCIFPFPSSFIWSPLLLFQAHSCQGNTNKRKKSPLPLQFLNIINLQHVAAIMGRFLHSLTNCLWVCIWKRKKWKKPQQQQK